MTAVAFAMMVLEFDGQEELTETEMVVPVVTEVHTPEKEGINAEQF